MKVLCAIDIQGGPQLVHRVLEVIGPGHELFLLHVIDSGPRRALEEYLHHPPPPDEVSQEPPTGLDRVMDEAEQAGGNAALQEAGEEAKQAGFRFQTELMRGRPEQVIVSQAQVQGCQLIAIQASQGRQGRPQIGPGSVGHIARFVLDHAPCDVLLLRKLG